MPVLLGDSPALLFEKPKGSRYPLLVNAFGSVRRMALALEVNELDEVAERIQGFLKMETPQGFFDKVKADDMLGPPVQCWHPRQNDVTKPPGLTSLILVPQRGHG